MSSAVVGESAQGGSLRELFAGVVIGSFCPNCFDGDYFALFNVITILLFSVSTSSCRVSQWTCSFWRNVFDILVVLSGSAQFIRMRVSWLGKQDREGSQ